MDLQGLLYICVMIKRILYKEIVGLVKHFPCVAILGPRQIGKTTLAKLLAKENKKPTLYLDVEKPSDKLKLADAENYLAFHKDKCIIIDEIQFMPELFQVLRPLIDEHRKAGRFIITGSASPALVKGVSESLAGRIAYTELTPIGLMEIPKTITLQSHWFRGGFPKSLTARTYALSKQWLNYFIKSYIERDLNQLFNIELSTVTIRNIWRMLANNTSGIWNAETYSRALGVTSPTVNTYLDYLEGAYLIRRLHPWYVNANKRLIKSPKVYIRDTGLLHRLVDIESYDDLTGNTLIGASWEGYVIEQIAQVLPQQLTMYYYRTQDGAEVDLVLVKANKVAATIEIKLNNITPTKGFYESNKVLEPKVSYIICKQTDYYKSKHDVYYIGLVQFLKTELQKIATL